MPILPTNLARVSNTLRMHLAQRSISQTQRAMLEVQNQLSTGKRLSAPSDDPADAAVAQQIRKTLEQRSGYSDNLKQALSHLNEVDSSLSDLRDLLRQAQGIASANVNSTVTPGERAAAAAVVESLQSQALNLANRQFEGMYLFSGDAGRQPFTITPDGITFTGSDRVLENTFEQGAIRPFMADGSEVFGALSSRVKGSVDLSPSISANTRLIDAKGATGDGIRLGAVLLSNGSASQAVDLSSAQSLGDVINAINTAAVGGITASIDAANQRIILTGGATDNVTVTELGGTTASDLGLLTPSGGGPGVPINGAGLQPTVTPLTNLADLRAGAGIDIASGLIVHNGPKTATIDLSSATTVEDLLNALNGAGIGVLARINETGTGIDVLNASQGAALAIAENGGTTAADLGIRTFSPASPLSELNDGLGVRTIQGQPDIQITRRDGTTFQVDLSNLSTIQDVIDTINTADAGGGVTASFSTTGNGIVLTDSTAGAGTLTVTPLNYSLAADDLGLRVVATGATLTGNDTNAIQSNGLLANLAKLHDAMLRDDQTGMTSAAEALQEDLDRVTRISGRVGAGVQEMEQRQQRLEDQDLATRALLSQLEDTDYNEAVTRFSTLQTALQANLQSTGRILNMTLLDFLG